jgi:hypothetical protein
MYLLGMLIMKVRSLKTLSRCSIPILPSLHIVIDAIAQEIDGLQLLPQTTSIGQFSSHMFHPLILLCM